jgi:4-carboxymuconolactone decarboxylase
MSDAEEKALNPMRQEFGDFAPALVGFTLDTLFGEVWPRPELSQRDRSLITVACLITNGSMAQLPGHLDRAKRNGLTETELIEVITHLAFYAGWPRAMSAIAVAKEVFGGNVDG